MHNDTALDHPYLKKHLIAYIGNKRALLPFLYRVFARLHQQKPVHTFLDPFAGSGAVSRLARLLGFAVHANDWECYSYTINRAHVALSADRVDQLFGVHGGIEAVIGELNESTTIPAQPYISVHWAPRSTAQADYRRERLFYTQENAAFIDRIRCEIDRRFPADDDNPDRCDQRALLIAALLYQAATHANTSGVFKACHKGFGGHGGDALGRIMAPMQLEVPVVINRAAAGSAGMQDASECCRLRTADVVYLDPPYNQHQYGSNYFMLNTIARWDRPEVSAERAADGSFLHKAGIRPDWSDTRSSFCSRRTAADAFVELLDSIDAGRIVLSYNDRGTVPIEQLLDICAQNGRVSVDGTEYVAYRGGRQSLNRTSSSHEFVLIVDRRVPASSGEPAGLNSSDAVAAEVDGFFQTRSLLSLVGQACDPDTLSSLGDPVHDGDTTRVAVEDPPVTVRFDALYRLQPFDERTVSTLSADARKALAVQLGAVRCRDFHREAEVLFDLVSRQRLCPPDARAAERRFLLCLRKLAHRKYRVLFDDLRTRVASLPGDRFSAFQLSVGKIAELADKRISG